jgi:hypothetical protein
MDDFWPQKKKALDMGGHFCIIRIVAIGLGPAKKQGRAAKHAKIELGASRALIKQQRKQGKVRQRRRRFLAGSSPAARRIACDLSPESKVSFNFS